MKKPRAYTITFASVYPLYIEKIEKKVTTLLSAWREARYESGYPDAVQEDARYVATV